MPYSHPMFHSQMEFNLHIPAVSTLTRYGQLLYCFCSAAMLTRSPTSERIPLPFAPHSKSFTDIISYTFHDMSCLTNIRSTAVITTITPHSNHWGQRRFNPYPTNVENRVSS